MQILLLTTIAAYLLSTAGYLAFLFLQRKPLRQAALALLGLGFVGHTVLLVAGVFASGHLPVHHLHGTLMVAGWAVTGVFLVIYGRYRLQVLGVYAAPLALVILIAASLTPSAPAADKTLFNSFWLISHIAAVFLGDAALALACGIGILYLLQENAIKSKRHGFFFRRLPSLDRLDAAGYACIASGFALLTSGLITGFVYAHAVWGRFWSADPKEIWSVITWLIYAALLHQRLTVGWRGRRSAVMAIVGFALILFTFLGVNFLLKGHHGVFTGQ
ncbi:MAG: c-type cytochrome biogenesis protein CcsB [Deltaproteobacteria bacterium]|nr:c-type cytochrome biogenesis protein CcsB [Deltaproteobacteria bacterium]